MSFGVTSSIGFSGNSLRLGLMDIKPIEIKETIKRAGIKFDRIIRTFESPKTPHSYSELVYGQNNAIFSSFKIPDWFEAEKLVKTYSQWSIESYENDTEYKAEIKKLKENKGRVGRPLLSFIQYAKNKFESEMEGYLEDESDRFLRSNFPLSFYNKLTLFDNTYQKFLSILEDNVRRFEFKASCSRNFLMYNRHIGEMKAVIGPIIDQVDSCFLQYFRLKHYITVWNAKNYKDLKNPSFLDHKALNYEELDGISKSYYSTLMKTRNLLLAHNNNILVKNPPSESSTSTLFANLVSAPNGSLTLEVGA